MQVKFVGKSKIKHNKGQTLDEVIQRSFVVSNGTSGKYMYVFKFHEYTYIIKRGVIIALIKL